MILALLGFDVSASGGTFSRRTYGQFSPRSDMKRVCVLLVAILLALAPTINSSQAGSCAAESWKISGATNWFLSCGSACGVSGQYSRQTALSGTYQWCGCNSTEPDCCHLQMTGFTDENGVFLGTGVAKAGECLPCPLTGVCQLYNQGVDTPERTDDKWIAFCDTPPSESFRTWPMRFTVR